MLIHQLTSIPKRINPRKVVEELALTNRLRTEGTLILMEAARAAKVRRVIAQSVSFFYTRTAALRPGRTRACSA